MIKYRDDKKEKWQSHEVYSDFEESWCNEISQIGYGINYEEAKEEYRQRLLEMKVAFNNAWNKTMCDLESDNFVEVNGFGNPIYNIKKENNI